MQTFDRASGAHLSEHETKRVSRLERLSSIRQDDECRHPVEFPTDEPQHVQGRLVGPVRVLDHEDRWPASPKLSNERLRQVEGDWTPVNQLAEVPARALGYVEYRPERCGSEERVAGTPEHPGLPCVRVAVVADQSRLPRARLPFDEDEEAATFEGTSKPCIEPIQVPVAFEQSHLALDHVCGHAYILHPLLRVLKLSGR